MSDYISNYDFTLHFSEEHRIEHLLFTMQTIFENRIINYDISCPEKYNTYLRNSRLMWICCVEMYPTERLPLKYFERINSMDKITWKNFRDIMYDTYPQFDETKFIQHMRKSVRNRRYYRTLFSLFLDDIDTIPFAQTLEEQKKVFLNNQKYLKNLKKNYPPYKKN